MLRFPYRYLGGVDFGRPYLELELVGRRRGRIRVLGVLDTGADYSTLPLEVAWQLGLRTEELSPIEAYAAGGPVRLGTAGRVLAVLDGRSFEVEPRYVLEGDPSANDSSNLSWGRRDLLRYWDLWLSECDERFGLEWRQDG